MEQARQRCLDDRVPRHAARSPEQLSKPSNLLKGEGAGVELAAKCALIGLYAPISINVHAPQVHGFFGHQSCQRHGDGMRAEDFIYRPDDYADSLIAEIVSRAKAMEGRGRPGSVHFRRGALRLCGNGVVRVLDAIEAHFGLTDSACLSIALDPRTLRREDVWNLADLGFNRFCLNVEGLNPATEDAAQRILTFEQLEACVCDMRRAGIEHVTMVLDARAHQPAARFAKTLDQVVALAPECIRVFGDAPLPIDAEMRTVIEESACLIEQVEQGLRHAGYAPVGFGRFEAVARACSHGFADAAEGLAGGPGHSVFAVLGFGAAAVSQVGDLCAQNEGDAAAYVALVRAGQSPVVKGLRRSPGEQAALAAYEGKVGHVAAGMALAR